MMQIYQRLYHDHGTLWFETPLNNRGQLHGLERSWWKNGNIRTVKSFVNGVRTGISKRYSPTGEIWYEGFFVNNLLHGPVKYYNTCLVKSKGENNE